MNFALLRRHALCWLASLILVGCSPQLLKKQVSERRAERKALPTRLEWRARPLPQAGLPSIWSLKVIDLTTDEQAPKGVRAFESPHAVAMHLFVVSRDLSQYVHLYPETRDYGVFMVRPVIPEAGSYQLFADYVPIGLRTGAPGFPTVKSQRFVVGANENHPSLKEQPLVPDKPQNGWWVQNVQSREEQSWAPKADAPNYEVRLQTTPLHAGRKANLRARVRSNAQPVTDLQMHLNGIAYGVAFSTDGEQFVRLEAPKAAPTGEVVFQGTFPAPGIYKIWLEFKHKNQIVVAPFTVQVAAKPKDAKPKT